MRAERWTAFFFALLWTTCVYGENRGGSVSGRILDAVTGEKLAFTNVFLAKTTIGDAADEEGFYLLENVPPGVYEIVYSRVGYQVQVKEIRVAPLSRITIDIDLRSNPIEGEEVSVEAPSPRQWRRDLKRFTRIFLGESKNAELCEIINPEVLDFYREPITKYFYASTDEILVVENRALGYRIRLVLKEFRWHSVKLGMFFFYPLFLELEPKNDAERIKWQKARKRTYLGSFRHFLASLALDLTLEEGFDIYRDERGTGTSWRIDVPFPITPDSTLIRDADTDGRLKKLKFKGRLIVVYRPTSKTSSFTLTRDSLQFDLYGNVHTEHAFKVSGEWSGHRVADMLPLNYWPGVD